MDHVLIEAKRLGADLVCPMFDGALFACGFIRGDDVRGCEVGFCSKRCLLSCS